MDSAPDRIDMPHSLVPTLQPNGTTKQDVRLRFMAFVDVSAGPDACWTWTGHRTHGGYGHFQFRTRQARIAHRVSWELFRGAIPKGEGFHGTCVCHRCDNRACVNPEHLFLGSNYDNSHDSIAKGRKARHFGTKNGSAKLSEADVFQILTEAAAGVTQSALGRKFGVAGAHVSLIARGKNWPHVYARFHQLNKPA